MAGVMQEQDYRTQYLDSLMDQAHSRKLEIRNRMGAIKSGSATGDAHPVTLQELKDLEQEEKSLDHAIGSVLNANEENVPYTYKEHYRQKYLKEPEVQAPPVVEPPSEGTSPLAGLLRGTKDTASFVAQHPQRAGAHANLGVESFASLPFRALETGIMGEKGEFPIASPKRWLRGREEAVRGEDVATGVDPTSTGPAVSEAVGGMTVPVGPTLKAGQHIKNILKGAGFAGSLSAAEEYARKGDITAEQTGTATGAGGSLTGLLSLLFGRGKVSPGVVKPPPEGPSGTKPFDVTTPPGPGPGSMSEPSASPLSKVVGKPAPVAGEVPNVPTKGRHLKDVLKIKPKATPEQIESSVRYVGRASAEKQLERLPGWSIRQHPEGGAGTYQLVPPGAKGEVIETKAGVVPEESALKTKAVQQTKKISGKSELLTPEEAINLANEMDKQAKTVAKEATLRDVISGKTDVAKVPMKRGGKKTPKSEAPAPTVKGEVGAVSAKDIDFFGEPKSPNLKLLEGKKVPDVAKEKLVPENIQEMSPARQAQEVLKASGLTRLGKSSDIGKIVRFKNQDPEVMGTAKIGDMEIVGHQRTYDGAPAYRVVPKGQPEHFGYPMRVSEAVFVEQPKIAPGKVAPPAVGKTTKSQPESIVPVSERVPPSPKRTEDFIKERGYQVREREPFPGEKEYDLIDPKSGSVIARGDRAQLTSALSTRPEAKGLKLYSFPGDIDEFGKFFKDSLRRAGAKVPEGVEVENMPHRAGAINTLLRPLETPEFNVRKSQAGMTITDAGREADRQINRRVKDLITEEVIPGKDYRPTKLSGYFSLPANSRAAVDKVLVLGDKMEVTYTPEELSRHGLTTDQVSAYQGVREALDKVVNWVKELGDEYKEFDARKIEGYIPRVWKGDWEIFVNGNKYLRPKTDTSSFSTLSEAAVEAHTIKGSSPDAKISIRFFPDPEYLSSRGLADARVVARLKANLERMGHLDSKTIDEAFSMGKSVKGFAKHLLKRKDAVGYETQDLDKVLNSYFYQAARRVEMQKVKDVAEAVLKSNKVDLSAGQVRYMQEYVERVAGKPAWDQIAIHNFVQDTPIGKWIDPIRGGQLIGSARDFITHLTLGFGNVGWALINLDGLTRHVWPLLAKEGKMVGAHALASEHYMMQGIQRFFKDKGLRQMLAHHGIIDIQMMSEPTPRIGHTYGQGRWTPEKISMILGTATEEFSRGVAAIARYQMALDHGASQQQAMAAAARFVEQTLGRYTRGGRPPAFTGAIGSTVGLFKTYMAVMLQNGWRAFESKDAGTIARYLAGAVGVSGILGLVPGIEDLDSALTRTTGWSPIETVEKNLPEGVATGLLTLAGVDISRRAGIPELFPDDLRGWAGPVIGRFSQTIADIANGEYGEALIDMLPNSVRNIIGVARGYNKGEIVGRLDKPSYHATPGEAVLHGLGLTPKREAAESRLYQRNVNKEAHREDALHRLTRKIASGRATEEDYARFAELGGKSRRIRNEQRRQSETLVERQYRHLPRILKREQPTQ